MTDEEIIELADKHNITCAYEYGSGVSDEDVIAFARAIQKRQRERLAKMFEGQYTDSCPQRNIEKTILAQKD
jgi:hypothetical protein